MEKFWAFFLWVSLVSPGPFTERPATAGRTPFAQSVLLPFLESRFYNLPKLNCPCSQTALLLRLRRDVMNHSCCSPSLALSFCHPVKGEWKLLKLSNYNPTVNNDKWRRPSITYIYACNSETKALTICVMHSYIFFCCVSLKDMLVVTL